MGVSHYVLPVLAILENFWTLAKNTKNGEFRPAENDFWIVEVVGSHLGAFLGTSFSPILGYFLKCQEMPQNALLWPLRLKMVKIGQKVKFNPFTFLAILAILKFLTLAKNTQNGQFRTGENNFLIVEVIEAHLNFSPFKGII